jgi:membrane protein DedA with SNARE-associated domain
MNPAIILALILQYRYAILVPIALIAGFPTGLAVGVVLKLGYLNFFLSYACIMLGELIGDVAWYWVGYRWGESFSKRYGRFVGLTPEHIDEAKRLFAHYDQRILVSSKLTTGFGFAIPILFTAGMTHMSFWRYMRANLGGQFIWSGGLIAAGYFFSDLYLNVSNVEDKVSTIGVAILFLLALFGFGRFAWKRLMRNADR